MFQIAGRMCGSCTGLWALEEFLRYVLSVIRHSFGKWRTTSFRSVVTGWLWGSGKRLLPHYSKLLAGDEHSSVRRSVRTLSRQGEC